MSDAEESGPHPPSAVADDGESERLRGAALPALTLESTGGRINLAELSAGLLVLFVYPHATGLPYAPVFCWDLIPGARGCTAEACGFRDHHARLRDLGAEVAGLSVQTVQEQGAFAAREGLRYPLISDPRRQLAAALGLPTFTADGQTFYRRLTLIGRGGRVLKVFSPVLEPEGNAEEVTTWLERGVRPLSVGGVPERLDGGLMRRVPRKGGEAMEKVKVVAEEAPRFSLVLEVAPSSPEAANEHFRSKLEFETDPADVYADLQKGPVGFVIVDARNQEAFEQEHIVGAINIPHRRMTAETTASLPKDKLIVTYCWGPGCNGSTKGAARLSALGFRVKELIGGIEYWKREGYPVQPGKFSN